MTVLKTNTTKNKVEVEKLCRPIVNINSSIEHYPELPQSDQLATYARFQVLFADVKPRRQTKS